MPTATYAPTSVLVSDTAYKAAALIPDATGLGDESDATYADQWYSYRPAGSTGPTLRAQFPALPGFAISQLRMRFEVLNDNGGTGTAFVLSVFSVETGDLIATLRRPGAATAIIEVPALNTVYDYSDWEFTQVSTTQTLDEALATGLLVSARRNPFVGTSNTPRDPAGGDYCLRVYELGFRLTTPCSSIIRPSGAFTNQNFDPATVVGTQPVLADSSDATYVESTEDQFPYEFGLEPLPEGATVDALTLHIRLSVTGGSRHGVPDAHGEVFLATSGGVANSADEFASFSDGTLFGFGFNIPAVDGSIIDLVVPLRLSAWTNDSPYNPGGPTTEADVVAALKAGAYLDFNFIQNDDTTGEQLIRVYEAWLEYAHPCGGGTPPRRGWSRHQATTAARGIGGRDDIQTGPRGIGAVV